MMHVKNATKSVGLFKNRKGESTVNQKKLWLKVMVSCVLMLLVSSDVTLEPVLAGPGKLSDEAYESELMKHQTVTSELVKTKTVDLVTESSTFRIERVALLGDSILIEMVYFNTSNDATNPLDAWTYHTRVSQEDDNAIYVLDLDFFSDFTSDYPQLSFDNPLIKPGGSYAVSMVYELETKGEPVLFENSWVTEATQSIRVTFKDETSE